MDDDKALEQFNNAIQCKEGCYYVSWTWKSMEFNLPENFNIAFDQMKTLSRRFQIDLSLLEQYCENIQSQVTSDIIEKADSSQLKGENRKHYLLHHPALTQHKTFIKVRIVFDVSVKILKHVKLLMNVNIEALLTCPICVVFC